MMAAAATAPPAGYSGKPAADKLGYKDGQRAWLIGLPTSLQHLATARAFFPLIQTATPEASTETGLDLIHWFTKSASDLIDRLELLQNQIARDGMIWISWPKKASKVPTDMTEDVIRNRALELDLVDVKVCAIDDIWSGLKLVIRKNRR
jgi:hypothetical protein